MKPGERLREFREKIPLDQLEFAAEIEYSQGYLSEIERGIKEPSRRFLKKLNEKFGISIDWILYGTAESKKEDMVDDIKSVYITKTYNERRLPVNAKKRKIIDKVLKILDSGNNTVVRALKSNLDAFLIAIQAGEVKEE